MEKDEDTTLWVLGLRTLVHDLGGVDPTFDALEFGRFLWERTLMGAREVAPPETVLTTLRETLWGVVAEVSGSSALTPGEAAAYTDSNYKLHRQALERMRRAADGAAGRPPG